MLISCSAAASDISVSTSPVAAPSEPIQWRLGYDKPKDSTVARRSIGLGRVLGEGPVLQVGVWSGGGAVIGSVAGPPGAVLGAAAGAVAGLIVSWFTPKEARSDR
ncbi:MAG: hypothetical protein M0D55_17095 [Elusimicrobiota bacterium]|nr:MAG: hypothetical protein M0D55_17095 [Elusimicrobiota bacterium]